jgi:phosphate/sulfate permease
MSGSPSGSSSSHALFGGLIGTTWVAGGVDAIHFDAVLNKIILPAVLSPVVAALIAVTATYLAFRLTARAEPGIVSRGSGSARGSRRRCSPSPTAPTTRRRRWA